MLDNSRATTAAPRDSDAVSPISVEAIWTALRCWWKLALPLGILAACGVALAAQRMVPPQYTAVVWLIVRDRPDFVIETAQREDPVKFVENQRQMMHSAFVLGPVAADSATAEVPELADQSDRVKSLQNQLQVSAIGRSDYFTLQFTSVDAQQGADLVNRVAESYVTLQSQSQAARNRDLVEGLRKEQRTQEQQVETLRKQIETLHAQVDADPVVRIAGGGICELPTAISQLQSEIVAAEVEQAVLNAHLDSRRQALEADPAAPTAAEIERSLQKSAEIRTLTAKLAQAKRKLREHERNSTNLAGNRLYHETRREVAAKEQELAQLKHEEQKLITAEAQDLERAKRRDEIVELENRLSSSRFTAKLLRERLKEERGSRTDTKDEALLLEFAKADYQQAVDVHAAISSRIRNLQLESHSPTRVEIFRRAEAPKEPDPFPLGKVFVLASSAFFLPFGAAICFEQWRRRVSSRGQIEESGHVPVLAEIASMPRKLRRSAGRPCRNRHLQLFDESINNLRTHLSMQNSLGNRRTIAITSAISGEGKSSLAWQLAHSIAAESGDRVLVIDGDLRSPTLHRLLHRPRGQGLADVLRGTATFAEAVQIDDEGSLHLLSAGNITASPHRLLSGRRFAQLIEELQATYDQIIIDTPPILSASEALLLASAADLVLLCVRRDFSRCSQTEEALAQLRASGGTAIGAILTDVPVRTYVSTYGTYYSDDDSRCELSVSQ